MFLSIQYKSRGRRKKSYLEKGKKRERKKVKEKGQEILERQERKTP